MPGLVPGIHVLGYRSEKDVDGRDKPGHDEFSHGRRFYWSHFELGSQVRNIACWDNLNDNIACYKRDLVT